MDADFDSIGGLYGAGAGVVLWAVWIDLKMS